MTFFISMNGNNEGWIFPGQLTSKSFMRSLEYSGLARTNSKCPNVSLKQNIYGKLALAAFQGKKSDLMICIIKNSNFYSKFIFVYIYSFVHTYIIHSYHI